MPILTPGPQAECGERGGFRLVRADNHEISVGYTAESMLCAYPIAPVRQEDGTWGWDYTGGESKDYDETAQQREEGGETLFQDEDGNDVPASEVAILDGEDREVGRLGAKPGGPRRLPSAGDLRDLHAQIAAFRAKCEADEKTDTGDAWELLETIADALKPYAAA